MNVIVSMLNVLVLRLTIIVQKINSHAVMYYNKYFQIQ